VGCVQLQEGLFAVVTVGHLLLLACRTTPLQSPAAAAAAGATAASTSRARGATAQQQEEQQMQEGGFGTAMADGQLDHQMPQQKAACVHYKDPQLLFLLDLRDVLMVAAEGDGLRLLCMAGDAAASADVKAGRQAEVAAAAAAASSSGFSSSSDGGGAAGVEDVEVESAELVGAAAAADGPSNSTPGLGDRGASTTGLRELLTVVGGGAGAAGTAKAAAYWPQPLAAAGGSGRVPTAAGVQTGGQSQCRWQAAGTAASMTDAELEAAAAGAAAAVAVGGPAGKPKGQAMSDGPSAAAGGVAAALQASWGGCKWFVGHRVPCGSDQAAHQLQQLLERACQRVEALLASSAWPRQLML